MPEQLELALKKLSSDIVARDIKAAQKRAISVMQMVFFFYSFPFFALSVGASPHQPYPL